MDEQTRHDNAMRYSFWLGSRKLGLSIHWGRLTRFIEIRLHLPKLQYAVVLHIGQSIRLTYG